MLRENLDPGWLDLLRAGGVTTLIVSDSETGICVLATVMGAVDLVYRVIRVEDAVCSSADEGHVAAMTIYRNRLPQQIETAPLARIVTEWNC
ncbi:MAG: isochorismatase family protein [Paracoccus sp. (in: a-proteobacteria)]|nr:isochorismatase family protein [Paracoccus sp. (in: a-proteobacteria)]